MKEITDEKFDQMMAERDAGAKAILAFLAYQGENKIYEKKASAGGVLIAAWAKARQSESGRMSVDLAAKRLFGPAATHEPALPKQLKAGR